MGEYSYIGERSKVYGGVEIGRYCSIADHVLIGAPPHSLEAFSTYEMWGNLAIPGTKIGHDVWIGAAAIILAGVTIGTGAVIGAGAVVTKDVEPYAIMVGNPARLLRFRFEPEKIAKLLASKWWELDRTKASQLPKDYEG
jgi:acetyltransferase-like isoleucine patch superfamily enzyme